MVRSATNSPRTVTRFSVAASERFSSARRVCQLPRAMNAMQALAASANAQSRGRKEYPRAMRYQVIGIFVLIVLSLGSALVFIYKDKSGSTRALKALALRVGLSIALFAFLML